MVNLFIHGIKVELATSERELKTFIKQSFSYFLPERRYSNTIKCNFSLSEYVDISDYSKCMAKISNNAYLTNSSYVCAIDFYIFEIKKNDDCLNITIFSKFEPNILRRAKRKLQRTIFGRDNYQLLRQAVILPVIWALARFKNIQCIHGAAVAQREESFCIVGNPGIGKTTLSLFYCLKHGYHFISDNYLLFDTEKVYPFPDWIRVKKASYSILPGLSRILGKSKLHRNGKDYYKLEDNKISEAKRSSAVLIQELGYNFSLTPCTNENAIDLILSSKHHSREFPEHGFIGLLDFMFQFKTSYFEKEIETLKCFLRKNNVFYFTVDQNKSMDACVGFLRDKEII